MIAGGERAVWGREGSRINGHQVFLPYKVEYLFDVICIKTFFWKDNVLASHILVGLISVYQSLTI